jgi:DNA polymerase-4
VILHADVDAFYASVAQRGDPALRGRPVLVGSWVVMAASYEARAYGIHGGMPTARARRLCPEAVVADTSFDSYMAAGREVFEIFERFSAVVEAGSMEEAFLQVSGGPAEAGEVAARLRRAVREQAGLPLSVGVARTKVLAKIASGAAKPDGLVVVAPERELAFLHPLPVERVWGIGPATARKLRAGGLRTVGEAAELGEPELMRLLGKAAGRYVHAIAHNHDRRPVQRRRGRRSFGAQRALGRRRRSAAELDAALADLAERLTRRMQRKGRAGRTVILRLRFGDYARASRSSTLAGPTAEPAAIVAAARELLREAAPLIERRGITLVGLTVTNITPASGQLELFEAAPSPSAGAGPVALGGASRTSTRSEQT